MCLTACSYNFSDDNFIDLEEPTGEGILILLQDFRNGDTINVDTNIYYSINAGANQHGIATEIYVDSKRIASSQRTNSGELTIRPGLYEDGEHTIRVVHELSSGTGSLAEQMQQESIVLVEEFPFIINRRPSSPPSINTATIENGSITITWEIEGNLEFNEAYLSMKFPDYEQRITLNKETLEQGRYIDTYTVLFPLDSNRPEDEDRSRVEYSIVFASEFEETYGGSSSLSHDPGWLEITLSFINLESFAITWPQHPLYANFESYSISLRKNYFDDPVIISATTLGGTQIINQPYSFGADYFGTLFPETSYDPYIPSYNFIPKLDATTFVSIPNMILYLGQELIFNPDTQHYYLLALERSSNNAKKVTIVEYSLDMELVNKTDLFEVDAFSMVMDLEMAMDPNTHNFYLDFGYRNSDLQLLYQTMELDRFSLEKVREYTAQGISGRNSFQLRGDILKTWNYQSKQLTLTNVATDEVFYVLNVQNNNINIAYLSNDGNYICIDDTAEDVVYRIENNTLTMATVLTDQTYDLAMEIHRDVLYYVSTSNIMKVVHLLTGQTISSTNYVSGNNRRRIAYDSSSNKILLIQGEDCFISDLDSNTFTRFTYESDKGNEGFGDTYDLWLTNGKLIHSKGIYVDIE